MAGACLGPAAQPAVVLAGNCGERVENSRCRFDAPAPAQRDCEQRRRTLRGVLCLMLGRSRMLEHYQRVVREDMLTLFGRTAELRSLECSIVLHGAQAMNEETKYRAACVLEILTGQRVAGRSCDVVQEDPAQRTASETQKREMDRARGALIQQSILGTRRKNAPKASAAEIASEFRKAGTGLKLKSTLHNVKMHYFLEKCREFYLPDVVGGASEDASSDAPDAADRWRPPTRGHDNAYPDRGVALHYQKRGGSRRACYPERYPVGRAESPAEAVSCYTLRSTDLLKFPDIEAHFEALGPVLGGARAESTGHVLQLIVRPTLRTSSPLDAAALAATPPVHTLRAMNYLLSTYFNAYLARPHVG